MSDVPKTRDLLPAYAMSLGRLSDARWGEVGPEPDRQRGLMVRVPRTPSDDKARRGPVTLAGCLLFARPMVATLTHACVITDDVVRLRDFYAALLHVAPSREHDDYVEFGTTRGALSLYARSKLDPYAPGAMQARSNRSVMLEFEVDDVDAEFTRLRSLPIEWVKAPSTQPWGNRSIYLRDPDGNLVNLYTPVGANQTAR